MVGRRSLVCLINVAERSHAAVEQLAPVPRRAHERQNPPIEAIPASNAQARMSNPETRIMAGFTPADPANTNEKVNTAPRNAAIGRPMPGGHPQVLTASTIAAGPNDASTIGGRRS
jgi:hypothetical protein